MNPRFWNKVVWDGRDCWLWTGAIDTRGYGSAWVPAEKKIKRAHRVSYQNLVGPIPAGLDLDHTCRVRRCVNPHHLEPVTRKENLARSPLKTFAGGLKPKAVCVNGHEMTPENSMPRSDAPGSSKCRICSRAATRRYDARKKGVA